MPDLCSPIAGIAGVACAGVKKLRDAGDAVGTVVETATDPWGKAAEVLTDTFGRFLYLGYRVVFDLMQPQFGSSGFLRMYGLMLALAAVLCAGVMIWSLISAGFAGRYQDMVSSAGRMLLLVPVVSVATPTLLWALVKGTHELSGPLLGGSLKEVHKTIGKMTDSMHVMSGAGEVGAVLVAGFIGTIVGLLLFLEMLFRAAALLVAAVFAPLVYSGLIHRALWSWVRKWIGAIAALILIEPITSGALGLGLWMGLEFNSLVGIFEAITIVLIAVLASGSLVFLVPSGGDAMIAASQARRQMSNAGPAAYVPNPSQLSQQSISKHLVNRGGRSGGKAAAGAKAGGSAAGGAATAGAAVGAQVVTKTGKATTNKVTGKNNPATGGETT